MLASVASGDHGVEVARPSDGRAPRHGKEVMPSYNRRRRSLAERKDQAGPATQNAALPAIAATVMASEPVTLQKHSQDRRCRDPVGNRHLPWGGGSLG